MMDLWKNRYFTPMLLEEIDSPFDSKDFLYEIKFDGIRAIIFVSPTEFKIYSRNKNDITSLYPELEKIKTLVKKETIFDGEIIIMDNGKPSFSKLQERLSLKSPKKIKSMAEENPVTYICFDILYEGKNIINLFIEKRKEILKKYNDTNEFVKSKYIIGRGIELFNNIKKLDLEGIIAKKLKTIYEIDTRSSSWIKIKNYKENSFFIGGYVDIKGGFSVSLILGEYRKNKFYYVGKVTLGKKKSLYKKITKEKVILESPFLDYNENSVIYLNPKILCNVKYIERTQKNHLRQPFIS